MCLMCQGWTYEQVAELQKKHIDDFGWSIVAVEGSRSAAPFAYTVGLTRFHDHPELVVTGLDHVNTGLLLNGLGREVRAGRRFTAGEVQQRDGGRRYQFVRVADPRRLVHAQEMYADVAGPVPALQVVHSTTTGRWPWDRDYPGGRRSQPLLGRPPNL